MSPKIRPRKSLYYRLSSSSSLMCIITLSIASNHFSFCWYNGMNGGSVFGPGFFPKVIFLTMGIIIFVHVWNEFLFSNTFLLDPEMRTVSLKFYNFVGRWQINYGQVYAASILTIAPLMILYFFTQKTFIEGITLGGIKG